MGAVFYAFVADQKPNNFNPARQRTERCFSLRFPERKTKKPIGSALNLIGFPQEREHVLLVRLHTGLVKGIDAQDVAADAAGQLKEVEQLA